MKSIRGFTLIELMIVVAIIAVLATVAITVYADSTGKAELSEAFTIVDGLKSDVAEFYSQTGTCPTNGNGAIAAATSYKGKYVQSAAVSSIATGCMITTLMRSSSVSYNLRNKTISFSMSPAGNGTYQWTCYSDAPTAYLPKACQ